MNQALTEVLHPALGSNQYKVKFGQKIKSKLKVKFATKVKLALFVLLMASLTGNYLLLKKFMVFECSAGGYGMTKQACDEAESNKFAAQEASRVEFMNNNQDLFQ